MITYDQAWQKVTELLDNQNLVKHCLAVEIAMDAYAAHFKIAEPERELWRIAGLLHDADWEKHPDKHPMVISQWLKDEGVSDDVINAIEAHGFEFGIEPKTLMAKTLRSVDELTGFIVAIALVKNRKLANVSLDSVKNKWGKKAFASGVKREDIERGAKELEIPLDEHIQRVLSAMQEKAERLGL